MGEWEHMDCWCELADHVVTSRVDENSSTRLVRGKVCNYHVTFSTVIPGITEAYIVEYLHNIVNTWDLSNYIYICVSSIVQTRVHITQSFSFFLCISCVFNNHLLFFSAYLVFSLVHCICVFYRPSTCTY